MRSGLTQPAKVLAAFSGGGDSTALLLCAREAGVHAVAAIIDHGVRPESQHEAQDAAAAARSLGATARIVRLQPGAERSQARLRALRYAALGRLAEEEGAGALWLGHQEDDQAETVLMRLVRWPTPDLPAAAALACDAAKAPEDFLDAADRQGRGWRGLAGMAAGGGAPSPLLRPLLTRRREALRAELRERGLSWIEDPSNDNPAFERVRARRLLGERADVFAALRALWTAAAQRRGEREAQMALWLARAAEVFDGRCRLDWRGDAPLAVKRDGLGHALRCVVGAERTPATRLVHRLAMALEAGTLRRASAGGALIEARGGEILIRREPAALFGRGKARGAPSLALASGQAGIWDRRLEVTAREAVRLLPDPAGGDAPLVAPGEGGMLNLRAAQAAGLIEARWRLCGLILACVEENGPFPAGAFTPS